MDDWIPGPLMDRVDMLPADIVKDQQVTRGSQRPSHLVQRCFHPPEVGKGIVTDQSIKVTCGERQMVDICLNQGCIRLALARSGQHLMRNIQRNQFSFRVALAQDRDQCAGARADLQNGAALTEKGIIRRQQVIEKLVAAGGLVVIPLDGKVFKELAQGFHLGLLLNCHNFWIITGYFTGMRCDADLIMGDICRLHV